jgi:hypothetical protein
VTVSDSSTPSADGLRDWHAPAASGCDESKRGAKASRPPSCNSRRQRVLSLLLLAGLSVSSGSEPITLAPAVNWVLPIFTDKEGYRSMTLRGSEVRASGRSIAVTDLSITIFSGTAATEVDSMLLSPSAVFAPKENRASGEKSVRFIRDDIEVTGVGWTYDHLAKKVSLQQNVRVTFRAQLNDILK